MPSDSCIRTIVILPRSKGKREKLLLWRLLACRSQKKIKVLTHWPRHIETTKVPKLIEGSSCASEPPRPGPIKARAKPAEEPELKKSTEQPKALSQLQRLEVPKASRFPTTTPKRRRMASVLDAVIESTKALTPVSAEAPSAEGETIKKSAEAGTTQAAVEAGPSVPAEARPSEAAKESAKERPLEVVEGPLMIGKEGATEESVSPAPGAPTEELEFIVRHASRKKLSKEQIVEAQH
jgi:hypothetical protein